MRRSAAFWLALLLVALAGCTGRTVSPATTVEGGSLRIGTATRSGVYYPVGLAMSRLWEERVPSVKPEVLLTGGGPENIDLLLRREAEVAFIQSGVVYARVTSPKTGAETRAALRGLTYLYPNVIHLVVRKDAHIHTPADLRGKRFIPGARGSSAVINSTEVLALYDLTLDDLSVTYLGYEEAAAAVVAGTADAALIPGGLPTLAVREMLDSGVAELLTLDAARMMKRFPWYLPFTVPAGEYPRLDRDVRTVAVANILVGRADLSDDLVYQLVKALYNGNALLRQAHPAAVLQIAQALRGITGVLELHPGAARYMREAGVLP